MNKTDIKAASHLNLNPVTEKMVKIINVMSCYDIFQLKLRSVGDSSILLLSQVL